MDLKTMAIAATLIQGLLDRDSRCSDDLNPTIWEGFTDNEKIALAGAFIKWNCHDPDDLQRAAFLAADDTGKVKEFHKIGESAWVAFFAAQLKEGRVFLAFPLRVYPHFGLEGSREVVSDPLELGAAIERGIAASPVGLVSLGNV